MLARSLTRELDDLRNALAKLTADYHAAIASASALQEALTRANLRSRRHEDDSRRLRENSTTLTARLERERQSRERTEAALAQSEALLEKAETTIRQQTGRLEALQQQLLQSARCQEALASVAGERATRKLVRHDTAGRFGGGSRLQSLRHRLSWL